MTTVNETPKPCYTCNKDGAKSTCDGCHRSFCIKHMADHRQDLIQQIDDIKQQHDVLKRDIDKQSTDKTLLAQINQWEKESIIKIQSTAEEARVDLKKLTEQSKTQFNILMGKLSSELRKSQQDDTFTENAISQWKMQLEKLRQDLSTLFGIELIKKDDSSSLRFIMIKSRDKTNDDNIDSTPTSPCRTKEKPSQAKISDKLSQDDHSSEHRTELPIQITTSTSSSYPCVVFGSEPSSEQSIKGLFKYLMSLPPMEKYGPMNGPCEAQTYQMERFLIETFGFENIPGKYIVQGVKSFQLKKELRHMDPKAVIYFPSNTSKSFAMTVQEIIDWQRSYRVYTFKDVDGTANEFLCRALQGQSRDGREAFRMKFVIRISTCPILMEFDAKLISRKQNEDWPNRIKLVSVTGIDFAGRKHDVNDILAYVLNWKEIYEVDRTTDKPALINERDFRRRRDRPKGELHESRLLKDLILMAKLRLRACDAEGVQIVVETGIGLGVFAGEKIGIAEKVQITSAVAIRAVLEEDGSSYKNIRAIVFALPIIDEDNKNRRTSNPFSDFAEQFEKPEYKGSIPVLIADQDMHRLTVAIARRGFVVSQLNPADSHGVFGEYWQNRGPAVEEKLALTTLGLLVQHHLINREVFNVENYRFI